jgi:hypothetical protein
MHLKNINSEIHRTATGPATSLFLGNFYLDEEVAQAELRRALTKNSFIWLLVLKALVARPITLILQKHSGNFWNYYWCALYINIHIIPKFESKIFLHSQK